MAQYSLFVLKVPLNTNQPTVCLSVAGKFSVWWTKLATRQLFTAR